MLKAALKDIKRVVFHLAPDDGPDTVDYEIHGKVKMKKKVSLIILMFGLACVAIAQSMSDPNDTKKYWQDMLVKPEQGWINEYGYSDMSVTAYNVRRLYAICQNQQQQINTLVNWVNSQPQWTFEDVNQAHPKYRLKKDDLLILEMGNWNDPNE
jgi:hypothetical protein